MCLCEMIMRGPLLPNRRAWLHLLSLPSPWWPRVLMDPLMLANDTLVHVVSLVLKIPKSRCNSSWAALFFGAIYQSLSDRGTLYLLSKPIFLRDGHDQEPLTRTWRDPTGRSFFSPCTGLMLRKANGKIYVSRNMCFKITFSTEPNKFIFYQMKAGVMVYGNNNPSSFLLFFPHPQYVTEPVITTTH